MSVEVRPFSGLGKARFGWLNASHHFSFGQYHDGRSNAMMNVRRYRASGTTHSSGTAATSVEM